MKTEEMALKPIQKGIRIIPMSTVVKIGEDRRSRFSEPPDD